MNESISSRHEGDLGGALLPFGEINKIKVTVVIAPQNAASAGVQHSAWMLINLLCRLEGVVSEIGLKCPDGIVLAGRVVPLADHKLDLRSALIAGGTEIGVVPIVEDQIFEKIIVAGADYAVDEASFYLWANGWCGGISLKPVPLPETWEVSSLPIGPYIAASLAAGEIFKAARLKKYVPAGAEFYSLWNHVTGTEPVNDGPKGFNVSINAALAGVGAVGCAFLHNLWACEDMNGEIILTDNDSNGLELTNLNRYVLFGKSSLGCQKATKAVEILGDSPITWHPHNIAFEELSPSPKFVISAVDTNPSRIAIQNRYPSRIFSASTSDLRAEVFRVGAPGKGSCLACWNKPEPVLSDDEAREMAKRLSEEALRNLAEKTNISLGEAKIYLNEGKCGTTGEALLPLLRLAPGEHQFAVSFVSVMAGTMLAAEVIKEHLSHDSSLSESAQRGVFQFFHPLALTNRASQYSREDSCSLCNPESPAVQIWKDRYEDFKC